MKNLKNKRLAAIQKYDFVKQEQSQSVNNFVIYFEMLENDLNEFTAVQKKNHLLYRLRKNIKKKLQMMTNMSITQNRLAALTQRIESSQTSKIDSENKSQNDRNSNSKFRSKSTRQRDRRDDTTTNRSNQTNNSINENRNDEIARLLLKEADEQSSDFKNEKIYYNCGEKKHITNKCLKLKQKNLQINIVENFRQNFQTNAERASSIRFIIEIFDESKN